LGDAGDLGGVELGAALYAALGGYEGAHLRRRWRRFRFYAGDAGVCSARGGGGTGWKIRPAGGFLLGACVFVAFVIYLVGTGTFAMERAGAMAAFVFVPLGWRFRRAGGCGKLAGFLIVAGVWVFGEIRADSLDVAVSRRTAGVCVYGVVAVNVRWRVFCWCGGRRAWGIPLVGENDGNCMCWGVSFCLGAWRYRWG